MNWLTNFVKPKLRALVNRKSVPENLWQNCPTCGNMIHHKDLFENLEVCNACNYHFRINSDQYVKIILEDKYIELWEGIKSLDPLNFNATKSYKDQIEDSISKTKKTDAISIFKGKIISEEVILCVMDFSFIGGSMGSVVGEKLLL